MFKMTQEERLALRFKRNKGRIILNAFGVRYTIRQLGKSPLYVGRLFGVTRGGSRELTKWALLYLLRDLALALPAITVILYTLLYH